MTPNVPLSGLYPVRLPNCFYHQFWRQQFFVTNCNLLILLQSCTMQCIMLEDLSARRTPCMNPCLAAQGKTASCQNWLCKFLGYGNPEVIGEEAFVLIWVIYILSPKLAPSTAKLVRLLILSAMTTDVRSSAAETCQVFLGLDPQRNRKGLGVSQRPLFRISTGARFENTRGLPPGFQGTHIV